MNNKEIFSKNLSKYLDNSNLTPTEFARIMGYPETTVFNWIHGKTYPRIDRIQQMADYFKVYKSELTEKKELIDLESIPGINIIKNLINVPILGSVVCGQPTMTEANYQGHFKLDPDIAKPDFSLYAEGDSMIDANIHEGDIVFFKQTPDVESGTIACVLLDDKVTLKKVIKTDNALILQPENDAYKPIIVHEGDYSTVKILGQMIGVYSSRSK